jgi:AraC-like DNA-binding protein
MISAGFYYFRIILLPLQMLVSYNIALIVLMLFLLSVFTILLFHKGRERYSNVLLAVYFISQILGIMDGLLIYGVSVGKAIPFTFFPIIFTWGPLFYFYIISLFYSDFRITYRQGFHFIPFLIILLFTFRNFYLIEYATRLKLLQNYGIYNLLYRYFGMAFNVQIIAYNIAAIIQYRKYQKKLKEEFSIVNVSGNNWIKTSLFGFVAACLIVQIGNNSQQFHAMTSINWAFVGNLAFFAFFNILFYKAIVSPNILNRSLIKEKYKYSQLTVPEASRILTSLEEYMDEKKPFTDPNLSLKSLSQMLNIPERYLSQVLNEYRQQNFFDFVNSYRVKYSMQLLKDLRNDRRIIFDIMFDAGFNSKSTFNTAFKKHSGHTPSEFKKLHSEMA